MIAGKLLMATGGQGLKYIGQSEAFTNSSGTTVTIAPPVGAVTGDLLVAFMGVIGNFTWNAATGWTEYIDAGTNPGLCVKVRDHDGSANYTFQTSSSASRHAAQMFCIRNAVINSVGSMATESGGTVNMSGLTMSDAGILFAVMATDNTNSNPSTPSGMTLIDTTSPATSLGLYSYRQDVSAGATGNRTSSAGAAYTTQGVLIGVIEG